MTTKTDFSGYALDGHLAGRMISKTSRSFASDQPNADGQKHDPKQITYKFFDIKFDGGRARGFWTCNEFVVSVADFLPFLIDTLTDGFVRSEALRRNGEK